MPKLIIVNGLPATGKSSIAKEISDQTSIAAIGKDDIKELFFDKLGIKDKEWSALLGATAIETLYILAEQFLSKNKSIIIEAPFWHDFSSLRLNNIARIKEASILEIYCLTDSIVRRQRALQRDASGKRHLGHAHNYLVDSDAALLKQYAPMRIGDLIEVDTTYPEKIDMELILNKVRQLK